MAIVKKISELTTKGSNLANTDLLIVGVDNGTDYDLKSITGAQLLGNVVSQTITNGDTTHSPSSDVVFDALASKVDKVTGERLITSSEATILSNTSGVNTGDQDLSNLLVKNTTITGATKTKITYDSKGLVTAGSDATTADIADSLNKRYVTDANLTVIGNTSGTNTGDETVTTIKTKLGITTLSGNNTGDETNTSITTLVNNATASGTPADTDKLPITNIGGTMKSLSWSLLKSTLNALFLSSADTFYTKMSNNLSDLTNTTTARTNLGLGSLSTQSGTFSGTSSGTNTGDQTYFDARVQSVTSSATVTPVSTNDLVKITAQAVGLTLANPTGTFTEGQALMIRIKDNGTARTIAFDTNYRAIGVTLPTTTVISKTMYLGIIYNSTDSKWDVIGYNIQA